MATRQERLTALADHLENKVTDKHFDMDSYVSSRGIYGRTRDAFLRLAEFRCGSTGCIAGWTIVLFAINKVSNEDQSDGKLYDLARYSLGLSRLEAHHLFSDFDATRLYSVHKIREFAKIDPDMEVE